MTGPHVPPPTTPAPAGARFDKRAALAVRRSAPFLRAWGLAMGALTALAAIVPLASRPSPRVDRELLGRLAADTLRTAQQLRETEQALASTDSALEAARTMARQRVPVGPRPAPAAGPVAPTVSALVRLIESAQRSRDVPSFLAVAAHPAVGAGPRMRALADSLRAYDARRAPLPVGDQRTALDRQVARTGNTILAIAENRRAELDASGVSSVAPLPASPPPARAADVATAVPTMDTLPLASRRAEALRAVDGARRAREAAQAALTEAQASPQAGAPASRLGSLAPAIAFALLLLLGVVARIVVALRRELREPTLADPEEATQVVGAPVLTVVRDPMLDGPARFRPSGVDPFRLLYLGLTSTGTRARTAVVTGDDAVITAATAARLAIAAAADHRSTLVGDLDAVEIPLSRTFRERGEPGLMDALAGAFEWREVARPVGSSDGLPITMLPAGTERDDVPVGDAFTPVREAFDRFRRGYELTILSAPVRGVELAGQLLDSSPVLVTADVGETRLEDLRLVADAVRAIGRKVQGVVVWDTERPELPSRAELAAQLSKRKGRTPGGSFEAVQRVINPSKDGTNKS